MIYQGYRNVGTVEGGIRYDPSADSYIVWLRTVGPNQKAHDLTPAYGNGVDAEFRLEAELLKATVI